MTPLMIAAEAGRDHNVDVLLRSASHSKVLHLVNVVERPDRSNRSAVHYAAINGHSVSSFLCTISYLHQDLSALYKSKFHSLFPSLESN